jgi:hypothetical protein
MRSIRAREEVVAVGEDAGGGEVDWYRRSG